MSQNFEIILFYKYTLIEDPDAELARQRTLQDKLSLKGRTLIAREGINATLEGTTENIDTYLREFLSDPRFAGTNIKRSAGTGTAFPKTMIKVKPEIVALGLGACDVDPNVLTGVHLKAEELHEWINSDKEFYIVDMRNAYEQAVGSFAGSIQTTMENFRDLPKFVKEIAHLKDKTVVTVCTGGVRCEKASGYLLSQGFKDVYQLENGIVSYMEKYPNEDFLGKLYVFDNRLTMGFYTDDPKHQVIGTCVICERPCERFTNCHNAECHRQLIACETCEAKRGNTFLCVSSCRPSTRNSSKTRQSSFWQKLISRTSQWI